MKPVAARVFRLQIEDEGTRVVYFGGGVVARRDAGVWRHVGVLVTRLDGVRVGGLFRWIGENGIRVGVVVGVGREWVTLRDAADEVAVQERIQRGGARGA